MMELETWAWRSRFLFPVIKCKVSHAMQQLSSAMNSTTNHYVKTYSLQRRSPKNRGLLVVVEKNREPDDTKKYHHSPKLIAGKHAAFSFHSAICSALLLIALLLKLGIDTRSSRNDFAETATARGLRARFQKSIEKNEPLMNGSILYLDSRAPNKSKGSGYGRAFDNLSIIAQLGHKVTLFTVEAPEIHNWCGSACLNEIKELGINYAPSGKLTDLFESNDFDIVLVSRSATFIRLFHEIKECYLMHPFTLVYDCEALGYRRSEMLMGLINDKNVSFPGKPNAWNDLSPELVDLMLAEERRIELSLISMSDVAIPVSEGEARVIAQNIPDAPNLQTIGHVMNVNQPMADFDNREGILFLASFHSTMYYNGDAIWYFLTEFYPAVIETMSIPLTIAGRGIPKELRSVVEANEVLTEHVTFVESPKTVDYLFQKNRIFIAPHIYGAGIQYKVSEALSAGIPAVLSNFTYNSFGDVPGCVGSDAKSYKQCILELHSDKEKWRALQQDGYKFIRETHSRKLVTEEWSKVINFGLKIAKKRDVIFERGEAVYQQNDPGVAKAVESGIYSSAFEHYLDYGFAEKRSYAGVDQLIHSLLNTVIYQEIGESCPVGEELYWSLYPDVKAVLQSRVDNKSAFWHWRLYGKHEGRLYMCHGATPSFLLQTRTILE